MSIPKFNTITSQAVPLAVDNIDTDQIIPARFLKAVERKGFGANLFRDWRYDRVDEPIADFVLNNPLYGGEILVAGANFGCGSSREHAAWALFDYGFRVVVSTSFADIFRGNALNNGLLPVCVDEEFLQEMFDTVKSDAAALFEIDLPQQTITNLTTGSRRRFEIDAYKKRCLLAGYDDVDYLVSIAEQIHAYENKIK